MIINCKYWININKKGCGGCGKGKYGGQPSYGVCIKHCDEYNGSKDVLITSSFDDSERQKKLEQERQHLLTELPKGFQLAKNLMRHLKQIHSHYKQTGRIKVSEEQRRARIAVCDRCKLMVTDDDGTRRCTVKTCGCYLDNPNDRPLLGGKAEYEALTCDKGHWKEIDELYTKHTQDIKPMGQQGPPL